MRAGGVDLVMLHAAHRVGLGGRGGCSCGAGFENKPYYVAHGEHFERVWREACAITTVEQLDALPDGAIVRDATGAPWHKSGRYNPDEPWWRTGSEIESDAAGIVRPALLIWHPEWARS